MTDQSPPRGGVPVSNFSDLDAVEAGTVLYLRLWFDGPDAQVRVWNDFARMLGADAGRGALRSFESLCNMCVQHGKRPLMRHEVHCKCVGSDERCFANFVACAAESDRDHAMLIATLLVRPDMAPILVEHATIFGLALKRMALCAGHDTGAASQLH